ncbi:MAG: glycosyltransferase family 4 protein [Verrucomicrobia bacterium]|nr:glycosyltransferase family 4 protein [Cytophagales bacterium]
MKILLLSTAFHPSIGGYETAAHLLAEHLSKNNFQVKIITYTPDPNASTYVFEVIRQPSLQQFLSTLHWCEVYIQFSVSLKGIWQLLFIPRPLIVTHHNWMINKKNDWKGYIKKLVANFALNIAVSHAIAAKVPIGKGKFVIGSPYQDDIFKKITDFKKKDKTLVFLGRLVSEKGADVLLNALNILKKRHLTPDTTIIGSGPEIDNLKTITENFNLTQQVTFVGVKKGAELVNLLNQHKIMVVPSLYHEPFGIVALEGIACGCMVVASQYGGLPDAIGNCGRTFPNGDAEALANVLQELLENEENYRHFQENAPQHLKNFTQTSIGNAYIRLLHEKFVKNEK